nr:10680_t:CDS:2 [Entrophospora candida]
MAKKVAIIGSGVSGLGAAWLLTEYSTDYKVTLYEENDYLGGHTHTVDYIVPSTKNSKEPIITPVDTGFIVFNHVTYPNLLKFFELKKVECIDSKMSFAISRNQGEFEWSGRTPISVFCQAKNLLSLEMWQTIYDIVRFNFHSTDLLELPDDHPDKKMSIGEYLDINKYSKAFRDNYLLPMTAAIWSTPPDKCSLDFPALTLIQFMHNHCLLQILHRIKWFTVKNGSHKYVEVIAEKIPDIRLSTKVIQVKRSATSIKIIDEKSNCEEYDHVIFATHADQTLKILGDEATDDEVDVLSGVKFNKNKAVLHCDLEFMPKRRLAFSSWNYLTKSTGNSNINEVSLYVKYVNARFIAMKIYGPVLVTLNPLDEIDPSKVHGEWHYEHPQYSPETIKSQQKLYKIQNQPNLHTTFAGAWTNYGFHEDGFTSGLKIAKEHFGVECPFEIIDATYIRGKRAELSFIGKLQKHSWIGFELFISFLCHLINFFCILMVMLIESLEQLYCNISHDKLNNNNIKED